MPIDARSPNRNYPVPNAANLISEDFPRLITALNAIDADVHGLLSSVAARALLVHTHAIADVSGLQAALDGKLPVGTTYTLAALTDVNVTGVSTGQFLVRGATQWQPVTVGPATVGAFPAASVSVFGASLIDDTDAAAARATLELGSSARMSDDRTAYGNANETIAATARVVALTAALTAPRTWTLPLANAAGAPPYILIVDEAGGISGTNTLTLARAGSDTINGLTSLVLNTARSFVILARNGATGWTVLQASGAANAAALPSAAAGGISATNVQAALEELDAEKLAAGHAGSGGGAHALATTSVAGFMSGTDKTKLDAVPTPANIWHTGNLASPFSGTAALNAIGSTQPHVNNTGGFTTHFVGSSYAGSTLNPSRAGTWLCLGSASGGDVSDGQTGLYRRTA